MKQRIAMITMQPKHSESYSSGQEQRGRSSTLSFRNKYSSHPFPNFAISSHHEVDCSEQCPMKLSEGKENTCAIDMGCIAKMLLEVHCQLCALDYVENFFLHAIQLHLSVVMLLLSQPWIQHSVHCNPFSKPLLELPATQLSFDQCCHDGDTGGSNDYESSEVTPSRRKFMAMWKTSKSY